jgi:hypothetical protein
MFESEQLALSAVVILPATAHACDRDGQGEQ